MSQRPRWPTECILKASWLPQSLRPFGLVERPSIAREQNRRASYSNRSTVRRPGMQKTHGSSNRLALGVLRPCQPTLQPKSHVDKAEQYGHLDEWADNPGQGLAGGGAEYADGDRNR
jgi:hypothetical protein